MTDNKLAVRDEMDLESVAQHFVKSGYFQDASDVSKAVVKIYAGRELGFGAFSSMTGIYIISGRTSIGANLMASAVKASVKYDYRIRQMDNDACKLEFFERTPKLESLGVSTFTLDDARKAGTKNLDKFPRNMLFARAMSNGVRWYCPDVFNGAAVYTPEELGATINEAGDVIDVTPTIPQPTVNPLAKMHEAGEMKTSKGTRLDALYDEKLMYVAEHATNGLKAAAEYLLDVPDATELECACTNLGLLTTDEMNSPNSRIYYLRLLNA
jgi:hypothetical protein